MNGRTRVAVRRHAARRISDFPLETAKPFFCSKVQGQIELTPALKTRK
jgi:hypothetical protein